MDLLFTCQICQKDFPANPDAMVEAYICEGEDFGEEEFWKCTGDEVKEGGLCICLECQKEIE